MNEFSLIATTWLLRTLFAGGLLLAAAWLLMRTFADPALREKLAGWAIRGAVLTAVLGFFPAWLTIPVSLTNTPTAPVADSAVIAKVEPSAPPLGEFEVVWMPIYEADFIAQPVIESPPEQEAIAASPAIVSPVTPSPWEQFRPWVLVTYGVIAAFAMLQLVLAMFALVRLRRSAKPVPEYILELLPADAPAVLVSHRVTTPVCFGFRTPTVLLPESLLLTATRDELRWVLAHELDHLRRGDARTGLWVGLARAVYFALPWFWALRRDLRLAQEYLADAAAAAGRNADYAAFLVHLSGPSNARRHSRTPIAAFPMRAGKTELFRRVSMLTQSNRKTEGRVSRTWSLLTAGGILASAVGLSGIGFADDKKPEKKVQVEVIVLDDDAKKDGEKKRDGEKKDVIIRSFETKIGNHEEIEKLSKTVSAALEKGDVAAAKDAMAKLNKVIAAQPKLHTYIDGHGGKAMMVPADEKTVNTARLALTREHAVQQEHLAKMHEKMAVLQKELAAVKDDKAARQKIETTIAELKAKSDAIKNPPMPAMPALPHVKTIRGTITEGHPDVIIIRDVALAPAAPAAPAAPGAPTVVWAQAPEAAQPVRVRMVMSDEAVKKMEEKIESLKKALAEVKDSPEAREALEKTISEFRKKIEEARKSGELKDKAPAVGGALGGLGGGQGHFEFRAVPLDGDFNKAHHAAIKERIADLKAQLEKLGKDDASAERVKAAKMQIEALETMMKAQPAMPQVFDLKIDGNAITGMRFLEAKKPSSGRLGILVAEVPDVMIDQFDLPKGKCILITGTTDGSPAAKAGIKPNDVLLSLAGKDASANSEEIVKIIAGIKPEEKFDVVILRKGKKETIKDVVLPKVAEVKVIRGDKKKAEESDSIKEKSDGVQFNSMSVSVNNDEFTIDAKNKEISVKIVGHFEDGKPVADKVSGSRDGVDYSTKDLSNLSKSDRSIVEQLLKNVRGGK